MWRFAPDLDPTTPGIYTDMVRMIPTPWGTYRTSPSATPTAQTVSFNQAPNGSALLLRTDGTARWVVGTPSKLYDSDETGAVFTDRSGANYGSSYTYPWQFAQYGNVTLAVKLDVAPQASTTGNFANLAGTPPKAALIAVQSNAVILANYNDGSAVPDGWWASDVGDHTQWTPGVGVDSAYGRLIQTPGPITALFAFGNDVYAFKRSSIYRGTYVGAPIYWNWTLVHNAVGVSNPNAVASDGQQMFFVGDAGAYLFDGATLTRIDMGVQKYFASSFSSAQNSLCAVWSSSERLFIYGLTSYAAYCPDSQLWGAGYEAPEAINHYINSMTKVPPGYTRRGIIYVTDVVNKHITYTATGTNYKFQYSSVRTGRIGNDNTITNVTSVIPLFVSDGSYLYKNGTNTTYPASILHSVAATRGDLLFNDVKTSINTITGRFDVNRAARWHRFRIQDSDGTELDLQGGMELAGILINSVPTGTY